jgi:DNA-binding response OmpR family regulator
MNKTPIKLLHVEDDRIQQALIARNLGALEDFEFEITIAQSETEALDKFAAGEFELVILDYHLNEGDGLTCLRHIRNVDPMVPVITVSGVATSEIAAELICAGADDYLAKQTLDTNILGQSVRNVLTRSRAFRSRFAALRNRSRAQAV